MMVTFDICAGNPGALQFLMQAYDMDMFKAEQGFQRMQRAGITGARLYMLWNDCCNRDTEAALLAMNTLNIESVVEFINYEGGRGIPTQKIGNGSRWRSWEAGRNERSRPRKSPAVYIHGGRQGERKHHARWGR